MSAVPSPAMTSDSGAARPGAKPDMADAGSLAPPTGSQTDLDRVLRSEIEAAHVPGLAAGIVKDDELVWVGTYGLADVEHMVPVTRETVFMLASVSKTFVGVALMQSIERGELELDSDIDDVLPFAVRNPSFRQMPMTLWTLMTHTSGIVDASYTRLMFYSPGDPTLSLRAFLEGYLTPGAAYFSDENFAAYAPGEQWEYSNSGTALGAFMAETVTGTSFDRLCDDRIFSPLGMAHTSYRFADFDPATIAVPYAYENGRLQRFEHYGYPDYPVGQARSTLDDMSRFVRALLGRGELDGQSVLEPETVDAMFEVQAPDVDPNQALMFINSERGIGHDGFDDGVRTEIMIRPEAGIGTIVLTNGNDAENPPEIVPHITDVLMEAAAAM